MEMHVEEHLAAHHTAISDREETLRQSAIGRLIVAVAKHRFARAGYSGTSLDDIRRAANLSWEDFRVHFDSKEALLEAVLHQGWKTLGPRLADIAFGSQNGRLGMLALLALMVHMLLEDEDWMRLVLFEGRSPDPDGGEIRFSDGYEKYLHRCTELVVRGQKDGSFRAEYHPEVVCSMLVGAMEGILRDRLMAEQRSSLTPYSGTYLMSAFDALVSSFSQDARRTNC